MGAPTAKDVVTLIVGLILVALVGSPAVWADRGAILAIKDINLEEPAQRAIIAHDGAHEILILQTDVKADRETQVVEFMPLPSKPDVSLAPEGCFKALAEIISKHRLRYLIQSRTQFKGGAEQTEAVKIVVQKTLGPHKVTVAEVRDTDEFVKWVERFFQENGLGQPALGDELRQIVADYLERGFAFFAFDIVTLTPETQTVQPLAYQFKTDHIYYPLKVTNLYGGGKGVVELFTLLPADARNTHYGLFISSDTPQGSGPAPGTAPQSTMAGLLHLLLRPNRSPGTTLRSTMADLEANEVASLHPAIAEGLGDQRGVLSALRYEGPLRFDHDVWAPLHYSFEGLVWRFVVALEKGDADAIEALTDVPFAFDRKAVFYDKEELMRRFRAIPEPTERKTPQVEIHRPEPVEHYAFTDDFHKRFADEYMPRRTVDKVATLSVNGEKMLVLVRQGEYGTYRIAGFSH